MRTEVTGKCRVFRKDFESGPSYSGTISKKDQEGNWDNAFINLKFRKGVELANKTDIEIHNGWLTYYKKKDGAVIWQIFISEFDEVETEIPDGFSAVDAEECPF